MVAKWASWAAGTRTGALALVVGSMLVGCGAGTEGTAATVAGPGSSGPGGGDEGGGSGDGGAGPSTVGSGGGGTTVSVTAVSSSTGSGGDDQIAEVYGHSAGSLYRLDPETKEVTVVGPFSGCASGVIDIALDKDSNLYGTTRPETPPGGGDQTPGGLWRIDRNTAACTLIKQGDYPNSLSFVPQGTLDAQKEALVGYFGADYVRIDTVTGTITTVRADALPDGLESSGDVVSVIDGPTLLTVRGQPDCDDFDCVVAVDPVTGAAMGNLGSTGYDSVFGVAFWAGSLYGFTSAGELFEFYEDESGGIVTTPITVSGGLEFYGAGSTTAAPPVQVPN